MSFGEKGGRYRRCEVVGHEKYERKRMCLKQSCGSELICCECALEGHRGHANQCQLIELVSRKHLERRQRPRVFKEQLDAVSSSFRANIETINEYFQLVFQREKDSSDLVAALEKIEQQRYDLLEDCNVSQIKKMQDQQPDSSESDIDHFLDAIAELNHTLKAKAKSIRRSKHNPARVDPRGDNQSHPPDKLV